jgi:hypothetical protein
MRQASDIAETVLTKLAALHRKLPPEKHEEYVKDLADQMALGRKEVIPPSAARLKEILHGTHRQSLAGVAGAAGGGLLGAGVGAASMAWRRGGRSAPLGLFMGIPGGVSGYLYGKNLQRKKELREYIQAL